MIDPLEKMLLDQRLIALAQLDKIDAMLAAGGFAVPSRGDAAKTGELTVIDKILAILKDHHYGLTSYDLHSQYEKIYGEINIKHVRSTLSVMKDKDLVELNEEKGLWSEK